MHRIKNAQTKNAQEKMLTNAHKKKRSQGLQMCIMNMWCRNKNQFFHSLVIQIIIKQMANTSQLVILGG